MGLFDASGMSESIAAAIESLADKQAAAIVLGFKEAAHIIADRLKEIQSHE